MTAILLDQRPQISEGATDFPAVDFSPQLDQDELLIGTPTVAGLGKVGSYDSVTGLPAYAINTDLTLSNPTVTTEAKFINRRKVPAGMAVQWTVTGQQAGLDYGVLITVSTTAGRVLVFEGILRTAP